MKDNRQKEQILKQIREALIDHNEVVDCETASAVGRSFINAEDDDLSVVFAQSFTHAGGTLFYCYNEGDIRKRIMEIQERHGNAILGCASENLYSFLGHLNIDNRELCAPDKLFPLGAVLCEALLAWNGSIVISSNLGLGSTLPALPETTVVLAFTSQVVTDWEMANERIRQLYPDYPETIIVTNPTSPAYRKGTQKVYLILIEDETI